MNIEVKPNGVQFIRIPNLNNSRVFRNENNTHFSYERCFCFVAILEEKKI